MATSGTLQINSFACPGPCSIATSQFGTPHFRLDAISPNSETGCFPSKFIRNGALFGFILGFQTKSFPSTKTKLLIGVLREITSVFETRPRRSFFTSNSNGTVAPLPSFPSPSPGFHPIFCRRCMPIPLSTGRVEVKVF